METTGTEVQTKSEMAVMGKDGDTKLLWDRRNPDEVENARRSFDDLRKKGYLAFRVTGTDGEKGEQMTAFDPEAERMIMIPAMRGG
jgi:hypothetical protein